MRSFVEQLVHAAGDGGSFCARRNFLKAACALPLLMRTRFVAGFDLTIGIFSDAATTDTLRGARMSLQEAQRAAGLLGSSVQLKEYTLAMKPHLHDVDAAILAGDRTAFDSLLALLRPNIPVIDASTDAAMLAAPVSDRVFHITRAGCTLWSSSLEQFGGAQLNDRYRAAYRSAMSSAAWAGWFAVKLLWEAASRIGSADPAALLAFLRSPRAAFDGHRGRLLRFHPATHVLDVPCVSS